MYVADVTLSEKLREELKYEQKAVKSNEEPEFLKAFKAEGNWKVSSVSLPKNND